MAPEINRIVVKLAGSMLVFLNASRHSNELPAKAIMASAVNKKMRIGGICCSINEYYPKKSPALPGSFFKTD
jgi:hypothetical protein